MKYIDSWFEQKTRNTARFASRRSVLGRLGQILVAAGASGLLPVLPFDRTGHAKDKPELDGTSCDYWRHCAIDGFLCSCCGGSVSSCPPGTEVSQVSWVGTCHNPDDKKDYIISYNDCCGVTQCGRCVCNRNERERPGYQMGVHNDINWCMSNKSKTYHCTVAAIVGVADK